MAFDVHKAFTSSGKFKSTFSLEGGVLSKEYT